jgi:hypothetical protein
VSRLWLLLTLMGLVYAADAAMNGRWFTTAGFALAATYWAFRATHPNAWRDAARIAERLRR